MTVLVGCSSKSIQCPKPIDTFTIYDRPKPIVVKGSMTVEDLSKALKAIATKSRVQEEILKQYEKDIEKYRSINGK